MVAKVKIQAGDLFRLFDPGRRERLFGNIARHMGALPREIQLRQVCHFFRADPAYGMGVAAALGIDVSEVTAAGAHATA